MGAIAKRKRLGKDAYNINDSGEPSMAIPGSSSVHVFQATPSSSKPAKKRSKNDPDEPAPEKRGAIFKKAPPKTILERVYRVMSQRFFMVDRRRVEGSLREEFSVLGSTGNIYTVAIDKKPICTCPDSQKGNHCKHILFIFLKVLQVPEASTSWYQKALLTDELEEIFANAPVAPNVAANKRVQEAFARATGKAVASSSSDTQIDKRRLPAPGDDCAVCYEAMHGEDLSKLTFCEQCGNGLHKECLQQWAIQCRKVGSGLSCCYCRAAWAPDPAVTGASGSARLTKGYINLAEAAGVSPVRDTSTYYSGPIRGQRYRGFRGYDMYDEYDLF